MNQTVPPGAAILLPFISKPESRAERKRAQEAEKEGSKYFIGPPNPCKYRRRGRWL